MRKNYKVFLLLICFFVTSHSYAQNFFSTRDNLKLYYTIAGKGKDTLVFLHGGPGQNMMGVAPDLLPLAKKHVLIAYDQRGSGRSDAGDTNKLTVASHITDLEDLRLHFKISKMTLVGQSWGCMLAAYYTQQFPERVKKLLLISPGPPSMKYFRERFLHFAKIDSTWQRKVIAARGKLETAADPLAVCREVHRTNEMFYFFKTENIKRKKGDYCDVPADAINKQGTTARLTLRSLGEYDLVPILKQLLAPALIIEGAQSPVPIAEITTWKNSLKTGKLLLIQKAGHGFPHVENPGKFFKAAEDFLKN